MDFGFLAFGSHFMRSDSSFDNLDDLELGGVYPKKSLLESHLEALVLIAVLGI